MGYLFIALTILFTVFGQVILKWRIVDLGILPLLSNDIPRFILRMVLDPFVILGLTSAVLAAFSWMIALTRFELTRAYPFMSLSYVLVLIVGSLVLSEQLTFGKTAGVVLIVAGTFVVAQGNT